MSREAKANHQRSITGETTMKTTNALVARKNTKSIRARKNKGASSVEYIIVLIFIAIAGIVGFQKFGSSFKEHINTANSSFSTVAP
jgi:Flp pilus assembly pilin Flp